MKKDILNLSNQALRSYNEVKSGPFKEPLKSELSKLFNLLTQLNHLVEEKQKSEEVVGVFGKIMVNSSTYHKLNKESKKLLDYIDVATKEDKDNIHKTYNQLLGDMARFSNATKGRYEKKIFKLKNQLSNEVLLYSQKITLQDLIDELTTFVDSIGQGNISLSVAKKAYSGSRIMYSEIENGQFKDELKQGLDIYYDLISTLYNYITELSSLNLVEHELERIRDQIRKQNIPLFQRKEERDKLIQRLENMIPKFRLSQIKKETLLDKLRNGY